MIEKELKGRDPATIAVQLPDGTMVRPFAFGRDRTGLRRGVKRGGNSWRMCVRVNASDHDANDRLLEDLMGGMNGAVVHGDLDRLPEALKAMGCHEVQGFLFSRPLTAGAFAAECFG